MTKEIWTGIFICVAVIALGFAAMHGLKKRQVEETWALVRTHETLIVNGITYPTEDIVNIEVLEGGYSSDRIIFTLEDGTTIHSIYKGGYTLTNNTPIETTIE